MFCPYHLCHNGKRHKLHSKTYFESNLKSTIREKSSCPESLEVKSVVSREKVLRNSKTVIEKHNSFEMELRGEVCFLF